MYWRGGARQGHACETECNVTDGNLVWAPRPPCWRAAWHELVQISRSPHRMDSWPLALVPGLPSEVTWRDFAGGQVESNAQGSNGR